jgi:hypothetical protein
MLVRVTAACASERFWQRGFGIRMTKSDWKESGGSAEDREEDGFLRRWARRKAEARSVDPEAEPTDPTGLPGRAEAGGTQPPESVQVREVAAPDGQPAPEPRELSDADMPPLESLHADSDYSLFLSRGVSPKLRQAALRQLFRQPKFNVETCLDDFQDDYVNFQPLGDIVTADMRHQMEVEARRVAARLAQAAGEPEAAAQGQPGHPLADGSSDQPAVPTRAGPDAPATTGSEEPVAVKAAPVDAAEPPDDQTRMNS